MNSFSQFFLNWKFPIFFCDQLKGKCFFFVVSKLYILKCEEMIVI